MASDRNIVESAYLRARAKFLLFADEVDRLWQAGGAEAALSFLDSQLTNLPEDTKEVSRIKNPEAWAAVEQRVSERKKGQMNAN